MILQPVTTLLHIIQIVIIAIVTKDSVRSGERHRRPLRGGHPVSRDLCPLLGVSKKYLSVFRWLTLRRRKVLRVRRWVCFISCRVHVFLTRPVIILFTETSPRHTYSNAWRFLRRRLLSRSGKLVKLKSVKHAMLIQLKLLYRILCFSFGTGLPNAPELLY